MHRCLLRPLLLWPTRQTRVRHDVPSEWTQPLHVKSDLFFVGAILVSGLTAYGATKQYWSHGGEPAVPISTTDDAEEPTTIEPEVDAINSPILTKETLMAVVKELEASIHLLLDHVLMGVADVRGPEGAVDVDSLTESFLVQLEQAKTEILAKHGLAPEVLASAIESHADDDDIRLALAQCRAQLQVQRNVKLTQEQVLHIIQDGLELVATTVDEAQGDDASQDGSGQENDPTYQEKLNAKLSAKHGQVNDEELARAVALFAAGDITFQRKLQALYAAHRSR
ncbi:hypothetical protein, variant 1 [Aphanomyces astaci]|nr:hypothetical protein, variant 1 [Aphanomyces astaci]ETV86189.1 hypothetical protein, variant 1 [Aphanomyces astaci]|eukprot:XP_009824664.1 hypothetical protein, variant 1 [Aphanomyces astaci]